MFKLQNLQRAFFHLNVVALCVLTIALAATSAHAMGRKRNADTQAFPAREISIGKIYDTGFKLPDGRTSVDMTKVIPILLTTSLVDDTDKFRVRDMSLEPGRYIINGGITSFTAEVLGMGIVFGYKPGVGDIGNGTITAGTGKVKVRIGEVTMDYHVIDTQTGYTIAATKGSALDYGFNVTVEMDFNDIGTGAANFVFNSPLTKFFRRAIKKVAKDLASDPKVNLQMEWNGAVQRVDASAGVIYLNAGRRKSLEKNNVFTVYADGYRTTEVKVTRTDLDYSEAKIRDPKDADLIGRIREGDVLKVFFLP